jgi:NAD(P)-dependent dehydrogenase (short-subunit alcohol dehydrogenase family)
VPGQATFAARLQQEWPRLDIVMGNAADVTHLPIEEWTEEAFDRLLATNLKAPFFLIKALLPLVTAGLGHHRRLGLRVHRTRQRRGLRRLHGRPALLVPRTHP